MQPLYVKKKKQRERKKEGERTTSRDSKDAVSPYHGVTLRVNFERCEIALNVQTSRLKVQRR